MRAKTFYLESYGCSMNTADSERLIGFLESRGLRQVFHAEKAALLLLNSCAVKTQTESRMLRRIRELSSLAAKSNAQIAVCGCLPKINPAAIKAISGKIIQAGPSLNEAALALDLALPKEPANVEAKPFNPFVSIIPIAEGCVGNCAYCCVKAARGELRSYSINLVASKFKQAVNRSREIWLTAQDTGCYGMDIGVNLPRLLKELLKSKKRFRIRVGMMNPQHLGSFFEDYIALFEDKRLYHFFHVPIQSGSDKILRAMNRQYSSKTAKRLFKKIRRELPLASIATDAIVGFPGETEKDFRKTVEIVKEIQPDVLNISRFGSRPGTTAAAMQAQLHGREKKKRSRALSALQKKISLKRNRLFLGLEQEIFVSEAGRENFVGRNSSYKAVVVEKDLRGKFANVLIEEAFPTYLKGRLLL